MTGIPNSLWTLRPYGNAPWTKCFNNSRTTWTTEIEFLEEYFQAKTAPFWGFYECAMTHFGTRLDSTDHFLAFSNFFVSLVRGHKRPRNFPKNIQKKSIDAAIFNCLMTSSKISFSSANYTPVTLPTQWRYQSPSIYNLSRSWGTRGIV